MTFLRPGLHLNVVDTAVVVCLMAASLVAEDDFSLAGAESSNETIKIIRLIAALEIGVTKRARVDSLRAEVVYSRGENNFKKKWKRLK